MSELKVMHVQANVFTCLIWLDRNILKNILEMNIQVKVNTK